MNFSELIIEIERRNQDGISIIAIGGFGGSGKSTLAQNISDEIEGVTVISVDDFARGHLNERTSDWNSVDWPSLEGLLLKPIQEGKDTITYQPQIWGDKSSRKKQLDNEKYYQIENILIVEGVGLLREELMRYFDVSVWIDCPPDISRERGYVRDRDQYKSGLEHLAQWDDVWMPNDRDYYDKNRPDKLADIIYAYEK